jgi:hypothetical protein
VINRVGIGPRHSEVLQESEQVIVGLIATDGRPKGATV